MKRQFKKELVPILSKLADNKPMIIEDPKLARSLGKELTRLNIRDKVIIGRDDAFGRTVAVMVDMDGKKGKNAWFEFKK